MNGSLTELSFRACVFADGMYPPELAKLFLGHLRAVLVKNDGMPGGFLNLRDLFQCERGSLFPVIFDQHGTVSFLRQSQAALR